jgi:2',3'-cyclic-nucleotide 2'-phosphodiesterase
VKIIFIGDIVGKSGRDAVVKNIPTLKEKYNPDVIIANGENAASGYGLTKKIAEDLFDLGIDIITLGNHAWDQREMLSYIEERPQIIRALNYPKGVPGKGFYKLILEDGRSILIIQVMLRLFMGLSLDDPFYLIKERLKSEFLGSSSNAILIDMHGETTSEKNAFGHYLDGEVTAIMGTHTHIPTSDARILDKGTAYQTDVGMSGDYNSVIGMDKENPIHGFIRGYRAQGRFIPSNGEGKICGSFIESNDNTGLAKKIEAFQI